VSFLVDSNRSGEYGGSGKISDWSFCRQLRETCMTILAGGISTQNLADAVTAAQPDALDLSSSVESKPGIKDPKKLRAFFAAVHELHYDNSRLVNGFFSLCGGTSE